MKRDAYGDGGEGGHMHKRPRHTDDEVTFLIPSKVAGSVIGKGGVNISKLRNQYKASITVPDCPGPERVLSITASDLDTTLEIVKEILPKLADQHEHSQGGPKGGNGEDLDIRMLIHQSRAGCVIGKAGAKIKELREKTGARLKIFSNAAPQSTERVVQLVGTEDSVAAGVREVLDLIRQTPIKGPVQTYDPHNYDDFYAEEYGGFGAGQGGGGAPAGPRARGPPGGPRGPPPGMGGPAGPPEFPGRGPHHGPRGGPPPPRGRFDFPPPPARAPYPPAPFPAAPPRAPAPHPHQQQHEQSTQVTIPKDLAGAIIGKAGTRIRKIRLESGAGIEIAEPLPGASERVITITGTPPRIQMAQYLLQQSVHESNPNLGGGGRGGNF